MKTELRTKPHPDRAGEIIVEAHYGGQLIGTITGNADGPGVLFVTERGMSVGRIEKRVLGEFPVKIQTAE